MRTEVNALTAKNDKEQSKMKRKLLCAKSDMADEINKRQKRLEKVNADLDAAIDKIYAQKKKNRDSIAAHVAKQKGERYS